MKLVTVSDGLAVFWTGNIFEDFGKFKLLEDLAVKLYREGNKEGALKIMNHWETAGMGMTPGTAEDMEMWYQFYLDDHPDGSHGNFA